MLYVCHWCPPLSAAIITDFSSFHGLLFAITLFHVIIDIVYHFIDYWLISFSLADTPYAIRHYYEIFSFGYAITSLPCLLHAADVDWCHYAALLRFDMTYCRHLRLSWCRHFFPPFCRHFSAMPWCVALATHPLGLPCGPFFTIIDTRHFIFFWLPLAFWIYFLLTGHSRLIITTSSLMLISCRHLH